MARVLISSSLAIAASSGAPLHAAAWSMSEQASVNAGYDDNVLLASANPIGATDASASATAHIVRQSDTLALSIDPRLVAVRYNNYSVLNRSEQYLTLSAQQQAERTNSSLSLSWTRDTTLTSELGLTGLTQVNKRHESLAATLSTVHQWSERWDSSTQLYAMSSHYMDAANTGLVNYNYGAAQLGVDYVLTPASQLSLSGSLSRLQVPDYSHYGKTSSSATLSYNVSLAQRWRVKLSFGPSRVRSDFSSEQGTLYEASLVRQSEITSIQLDVTRDITPTGQGVLTQREQFSLDLSKALTERLNVHLGASWVKNNNLLLADNLAFDEVRYSDVNASFNWQLTPTWTLSLSGGHTEQRSESATQYAIRNHAAISVTWSGLSHRPRHLLH